MERRTEKYWLGSKEKLKAAMRHKIKRAFVGSLDAIERELDEWEFSEKDKDQFMTAIRRRILGNGNDQIRNMESELDKYNVEFMPYHIEFREVELEGDNDEG
jgi:hypothetical protein